MTHSYQTGCRCVDCTEANRVYQLRYRIRRREREAEALRDTLTKEFETLGISPEFAKVAAKTAYLTLKGNNK